MLRQHKFLAVLLLGLMPDYVDEPYNPSAVLPLRLALITLVLNGGLMMLASESEVGSRVLQVQQISLITSTLISD